MQGIVGFCGGSLYSLSLTVLSDGRRPDRYFAYAIGAQTIYQIFGLMAGPFLIHHGGVNAMLLLFVGLGVLGLLLVGFLPVHGRVHRAAAADAGLLSRPVAFALAGCFLFYINVGAYWTYVERIGVTAGIDLTAISNGLALATAASMAGVFLASWLGVRRGFFVPIAVSAVGVVLAMALLTGDLRVPAYVLSAVLYGIAWNMSMTYQYGVVNVTVADAASRSRPDPRQRRRCGRTRDRRARSPTKSDHSGVLWLGQPERTCELMVLPDRASSARTQCQR